MYNIRRYRGIIGTDVKRLHSRLLLLTSHSDRIRAEIGESREGLLQEGKTKAVKELKDRISKNRNLPEYQGQAQKQTERAQLSPRSDRVHRLYFRRKCGDMRAHYITFDL